MTPPARTAAAAGLRLIGHSDLARRLGFTDSDDMNLNRSERFSDVLDSFARGSRAGVALDLLMEHFRDVNDTLRAYHQARQDAFAFGQPDPVDPRKHGYRWILGNDLRGYILLGDPAVRLQSVGARNQ